MSSKIVDRSVIFGFALLLVSLPFGLALETLHAFKVQAYFSGATRRELWTLAHAHGNLLGIWLLVFGGFGRQWFPVERTRRRIESWLLGGALCMPLGFFAGGCLSSEGDPSLGILLVPLAGLALVVATALALLDLLARRQGALARTRGDEPSGT